MVTAGERNPSWPPGVEHLALPDANGRVDLDALMRALADRGINELHVEAGGKLNGALLDARLVDELLLYIAPCLIGDPARGIAEFASGLGQLSDRIALSVRDMTKVGDDLRIIARVTHQAS